VGLDWWGEELKGEVGDVLGLEDVADAGDGEEDGEGDGGAFHCCGEVSV
jgi:hypothetical protein